MTGAELGDFEAELPSLNDAEAEKEGAAKLGSLLRRECAAPELKNAVFAGPVNGAWPRRRSDRVA